MLNKVTFGSDSEVIVMDITGRPFPVCGMLGGTKDAPRKLANSKFMIQEDNALLEYNTPVYTSVTDFARGVVSGAQRSLQELPPTLMPSYQSTAVYDEAFNRVPQVMVFGCDPDFNVYTQQQNPRPENLAEPMLRSAAGHIHIGWDNPTKESQIAVVKACDLFLGLPSVWQSDDRRRRTLYGKAGTFRPKDYGIEYRVLDNYWIFNVDWAMEIANGLLKVIKFVNTEKKIREADEVDIQQAINNYDVKLAEDLYRKYTKGDKLDAPF